MADGTYQPKTYRDRGGDRFNAVSGAAVVFEAGSTFSCAGVAGFTGALRQSDSNPNAVIAQLFDQDEDKMEE